MPARSKITGYAPFVLPPLSFVPLFPPKDGERLRKIRAVEVLESIGTAEAHAILKHLAAGEPKAALTREAKVALGRLDAK